MKSRKVLLGLFVGLIMCQGGALTAQTKANSNLIEVGPDNVGGRVRSLILDNSDTTHQTIYAGAVGGGLFKNVGDARWESVPCVIDGRTIVLPISAMVQGPDNTIYIATGESYYQMGDNFKPMAPMGRGIYRYNPTSNTFSVISTTVPNNIESQWAAINDVALLYLHDTLYFYAATPKGLYCWNVTSEQSWSSQPRTVFTGKVDDLQMLEALNMLYFTSDGSLYKISDVINNGNPINITGSCSAFGAQASNIKLAVSPEEPNYLYAMVANENGLLSGLYLTTNLATWNLLTTPTIVPFSTTDNGTVCGAVCVHPNNPKTVFIGGSTLWVGNGFVEGSYYQWTQSSYNEGQLNYGNYMASVFSSNYFVHSGIHDILPVLVKWEDGMPVYKFYIATDGGVFISENEMTTFSNLNHGLNAVQVNGLAVCPDGSVISGANDNSCPFIEARLGHNGGDTNANHNANIIWTGNGGEVAASMFQQVLPNTRRGIFVSSNGGVYGRSYSDYADFTNTQTWTSNSDFFTTQGGGLPIPRIRLWECTNNTMVRDSITFTIDTFNAAIRNGEEVFYHLGDQVKAGDKITAYSTANYNYPFTYNVPQNFTLTNETMHVRTINPILSRMFVASTKPSGSVSSVFMSWYPNDFTKVYVDNSHPADEMMWAEIFFVRKNKHEQVRNIAVSTDGDCCFVAVDNTDSNMSYIVRVKNINGVNYCQTNDKIQIALTYEYSGRTTVVDTIYASKGNVFFPRVITSMNVNPRQGNDELIVTFGGYGNEGSNVVSILNATGPDTTITIIEKNIAAANGPAYSSLVEYTTGDVYVGTENGIYKASDTSFADTSFAGTPSWSEYGDFAGVPVTCIAQQTKELQSVTNTIHTNAVTFDNYVYAKTKYPFAMYFGTYGRGIFMDMQYVTDTTNEIVDSTYYLGVPRVANVGNNSVRVYPNPATVSTTIELNVAQAGNATVVIFDLNGRMVRKENMGRVSEGTVSRTLSLQGLTKGMYLVNVIVGDKTATTKLIVR